MFTFPHAHRPGRLAYVAGRVLWIRLLASYALNESHRDHA
jgi:hypothetical protein